MNIQWNEPLPDGTEVRLFGIHIPSGACVMKDNTYEYKHFSICVWIKDADKGVVLKEEGDDDVALSIKDEHELPSFLNKNLGLIELAVDKDDETLERLVEEFINRHPELNYLKEWPKGYEGDWK